MLADLPPAPVQGPPPPPDIVEMKDSSPRKRTREEEEEKEGKKEKEKEEREREKKRKRSSDKPPCSQPQGGSAVGSSSQWRTELQGLEAEVIERMDDMLVGPIVSEAADSSIDLLEYLKVSLLTGAHMVAGAQMRDNATKEELDKLKANFQGGLSDVEDEHWREMAELQDRLNLVAGERDSLLSERAQLQSDLAGGRAKIKSLESAQMSWEADRRRLEAKQQFASSSRDRIFRRLTAANKKIDSLYSYEAAIEKYKDSKDFDFDIRKECLRILEEINENYEATLKRLFPSANMDLVLVVLREECEAAEERRAKAVEAAEQEEEALGPPLPAVISKGEAGTSWSAEDLQMPMPPATDKLQQQ